MTPNEFRKLALALPGAAEGAHMEHPDFRAGGRIFASLAADGARGMVKVERARQARLARAHPDAFEPAAGAWGRQGCTMVRLAVAPKAVVRDALAAAHALVLQEPGRARSRRAGASRMASAPRTAAPRFFATPAAFRAWLERHHEVRKELLVGFRKVGSGRPSITWQESVDEALCFGWIDGVRRRLDGESYTIRFTPRRPESVWSAINARRAQELQAEGRMRPAGAAAFARRDAAKTAVYSYDAVKSAKLGRAARRELAANPRAWAYYRAQPPSYRRLAAHYVESAKQAATRARRLRRLIRACAAGKRL